jgi:hypothetical protein
VGVHLHRVVEDSMGRHQLRLLKFAIKYRGWQGFGTDSSTTNAVRSLVRMGLLEVNEFRQFRLVRG